MSLHYQNFTFWTKKFVVNKGRHFTLKNWDNYCCSFSLLQLPICEKKVIWLVYRAWRHRVMQGNRPPHLSTHMMSCSCGCEREVMYDDFKTCYSSNTLIPAKKEILIPLLDLILVSGTMRSTSHLQLFIGTNLVEHMFHFAIRYGRG